MKYIKTIIDFSDWDDISLKGQKFIQSSKYFK